MAPGITGPRAAIAPARGAWFLWCGWVLCAGGTLAPAAPAPDAREVLKIVRGAQSAQSRELTGRLRSAGRAIPFKLSIVPGTIQWEFSNAPTLLLRLGEKESRLEEIGKSGGRKVTPARFDEKVSGSDITYEDLSLQFLYWPDATIEGEQTMVLQKCWIVRVEPPSKGVSQYSRVKLWIAKENGALMQAEAFDHNGRFARRFKVVSGQRTDEGLWVLKSMRIETPSSRPGSALTQSYLEIDPVR
ncbi:MAG: outer membrane lipoprotein-sorting protein [Verrucomicrobiota bacterium]|nr:outer membrane lipoprotein-sorting protein [Verrucomicrobiota bacterium]